MKILFHVAITCLALSPDEQSHNRSPKSSHCCSHCSLWNVCDYSNLKYFRLEVIRARQIRSQSDEDAMKNAIRPGELAKQNEKLMKMMSYPFYYRQNCDLTIDKVYHPDFENPNMIDLKKGLVAGLSAKIQKVSDSEEYKTLEAGLMGTTLNHYRRQDLGEGVSVFHRQTHKIIEHDELKHAHKILHNEDVGDSFSGCTLASCDQTLTSNAQGKKGLLSFKQNNKVTVKNGIVGKNQEKGKAGFMGEKKSDEQLLKECEDAGVEDGGQAGTGMGMGGNSENSENEELREELDLDHQTTYESEEHFVSFIDERHGHRHGLLHHYLFINTN